jgi:hypothetical protein
MNATPLLQQHKDSNSSPIKATVRALFSSGRKLTAKEINECTGTNDARKVISDLRVEGWAITDMVLPSRCKLYWLVSDDRQLSLFEKKGGENERK